MTVEEVWGLYLRYRARINNADVPLADASGDWREYEVARNTLSTEDREIIEDYYQSEFLRDKDKGKPRAWFS